VASHSVRCRVTVSPITRILRKINRRSRSKCCCVAAHLTVWQKRSSFMWPVFLSSSLSARCSFISPCPHSFACFCHPLSLSLSLSLSLCLSLFSCYGWLYRFISNVPLTVRFNPQSKEVRCVRVRVHFDVIRVLQSSAVL
jgi:hypothetical protein